MTAAGRTAATPSMAPSWLASLPGIEAVRRDAAGVELDLRAGADPAEVLAGVVAHEARIARFEVVEPSLEALFIEHVGRPADDEATLAPGLTAAPMQPDAA